MQNNPLVSIIIPNYNRAHLIGETLDSILTQSYTNWECIVVDDGSTDDTEAVVMDYVKKDARFQYHPRPTSKPKGANACRNFGFEISNGDYINWFDSDDLMHEDKLLLQVNQLNQSVLYFSVCQTLVFRENKENIIGLRSENIISDSILEDFIKQKIVFLTQAPLFKRRFIVENNLFFDEELQAAQEWEFFCRCIFFAKKYEVIEIPLVFFRSHNNSVSSSFKIEMKNWHYYLARKKVFKFLKNKKESQPFREYFHSYAFDYFKKLIEFRDLKKSVILYFDFIYNQFSFAKSVLLFFYIFMRCFFNTGYRYRKIFNL
jgi:glycosyltransferase involved in cell wall biosynthesis